MRCFCAFLYFSIYLFGCTTTSTVAGKSIHLVPYYPEKDKKVEGIRFVSIKEGSVFEELGFEEGDIIKEANGEPMKTPEKVLEFFGKLKGKKEFKILIRKKNGTHKVLHFNVSD